MASAVRIVPKDDPILISERWSLGNRKPITRTDKMFPLQGKVMQYSHSQQVLPILWDEMQPLSCTTDASHTPSKTPGDIHGPRCPPLWGQPWLLETGASSTGGVPPCLLATLKFSSHLRDEDQRGISVGPGPRGWSHRRPTDDVAWRS